MQRRSLYRQSAWCFSVGDAWNKFGQMVSSAEAMFSCLFILVFGAVALCGTGVGQLPVASIDTMHAHSTLMIVIQVSMPLSF